MARKIGVFLLSLWLLFILIIIITIKKPLCLSEEFDSVVIFNLLKINAIPLVCAIAFFLGLLSYLDFRYKVKGSPELSFKLICVEKIDYEHLTFLTTYIIPLVCFQFENFRYLIAFSIILIVIGLIYIRTNLFYANPTLAILSYRIYKVKGEFRKGKIRNNKILISRDILRKEDRVKYFKLDENIYYASKI